MPVFKSQVRLRSHKFVVGVVVVVGGGGGGGGGGGDGGGGVAYLTSQQHAGVSQERICSDKCCHAEIEVASPACYFTQSQSEHDLTTWPG